MRLKLSGLVAVVLMVASACGGNGGGEETSSDSDANGVTSSAPAADSASEDGGASTGPGATATVTIGSDVHEVDGDVACLTGAAVSVTFANDSDQITINHANDVILIRMTIDGEDWVDAGSPPAPGVTGGGEDAIVTWSGPMSSNGATEAVSIEVHC